MTRDRLSQARMVDVLLRKGPSSIGSLCAVANVSESACRGFVYSRHCTRTPMGLVTLVEHPTFSETASMAVYLLHKRGTLTDMDLLLAMQPADKIGTLRARDVRSAMNRLVDAGMVRRCGLIVIPTHNVHRQGPRERAVYRYELV